jgi:hypothetical protein
VFFFFFRTAAAVSHPPTSAAVGLRALERRIRPVRLIVARSGVVSMEVIWLRGPTVSMRIGHLFDVFSALAAINVRESAEDSYNGLVRRDVGRRP